MDSVVVLLILVIVTIIIFCYLNLDDNPSPTKLDTLDVTPLTMYSLYSEMLKLRYMVNEFGKDITGRIDSMSSKLDGKTIKSSSEKKKIKLIEEPVATEETSPPVTS